MMVNYRIFPLVGLIAVLLMLVPVFLFGMGAVIKFFQLMWSPSVPGSIPVWAIFVVAIIVLYIKKRSRY